MVLMLSKHKCSLLAKDGIQFIDHSGKSYTLGKGRNIIGRDTVSTVIMDPSLRDISRLHLVIENIDDSSLQLTDLSSHGCFMAKKFLEHHSSW